MKYNVPDHWEPVYSTVRHAGDFTGDLPVVSALLLGWKVPPDADGSGRFISPDKLPDAYKIFPEREILTSKAPETPQNAPYGKFSNDEIKRLCPEFENIVDGVEKFNLPLQPPYVLKLLQATAELRAEVDAQITANIKLMDKIDRLNDALKGSHALLKIAQEGREKAEATAREHWLARNKAEAQVAALVESLTSFCCCDSPEDSCEACTARTNLKTTAAAHDARVREAAIREFAEKFRSSECACFLTSNPPDGSCAACQTIDALLPNQQGEGV